MDRAPPYAGREEDREQAVVTVVEAVVDALVRADDD
jgi:hypothetical protein